MRSRNTGETMTQDMQQLQDLRNTLDAQRSQIKAMRAELQALGLEDKQPDLNALSPEERDQLFAFEREMRDITATLSPEPSSAGVHRNLHDMV